MASFAAILAIGKPVALDAKAIDGLRGLLAEHVAQGGMVLFTSHQPVVLSSPSGTSVAVQTFRLRGVA